ncbi:MAG: SCO family protein [Sideroxyarcus sp.]|nr:SCO family protein [Sideroxyarcus sp.]
MKNSSTATTGKTMTAFLLFTAIMLSLWAEVAAAAPAGSPWGANYFPNITLTNQDGKKLRFYDDLIKDKVVAINFMYATCHDSCPLETAKLRQVQDVLGDRVGKDIFMYSITITPEADTPETLKDYMEKYKVKPGWQFLTGNKDDILLLRTKLGLYDGEETEKSQGHTMSMIVGNESTGQWIKRSSFDNPKVLARVIGEVLFNYKTRVGQNNNYADVSQVIKLDPGEDLFFRRCLSCHTVGAGDALGPDLLNVVANRDRTWLHNWLKNPDQMLAAKDPIATALFEKFKGVIMPNLRLTDGEVETLLGYIDTESRRIEKMRLASLESMTQQTGQDEHAQHSEHQQQGGHDMHEHHH